MTRVRCEKGAAAVEMALIVPLLALLAMGIIDVGRILVTSIEVQEAAQEGALYAVYHPTERAAITARVTESVDTTGIESADVSIACAGSAQIEVDVRHDLGLITPLVGQWFGGSITVARTVRGDIVSGEACA